MKCGVLILKLVHINPNIKNIQLQDQKYHRCQFQASWFKTYSTWLEYSPLKNAIFCHRCYIFAKQATGHPGSDAFTVKGFNN